MQSSCVGRVRKAAGGAGLFAGLGGCWGAGRMGARLCEHADFKGVPEEGAGLPQAAGAPFQRRAPAVFLEET